MVESVLQTEDLSHLLILGRRRFERRATLVASHKLREFGQIRLVGIDRATDRSAIAFDRAQRNEQMFEPQGDRAIG